MPISIVNKLVAKHIKQSEITLLVAGSDIASVTSEAQQLNGVTKILACFVIRFLRIIL